MLRPYLIELTVKNNCLGKASDSMKMTEKQLERESSSLQPAHKLDAPLMGTVACLMEASPVPILVY